MAYNKIMMSEPTTCCNKKMIFSKASLSFLHPVGQSYAFFICSPLLVAGCYFAHGNSVSPLYLPVLLLDQPDLCIKNADR